MTSERWGQRGITLVELMVAMAVSSILVLFMLGVQTQLSQGFRGQTVSSDVNSNMRMAAGAMRREIAHAGYLLPDGEISVAPAVDLDGRLSGFSVRNDPHGTGPDELYMIFANDSRLQVIDDFQNNTKVDVDDTNMFDEGEIVVLASSTTSCLLEITGTGHPNFIEIEPNDGGYPFNDPGSANQPNPHCDELQQALEDGESTLIYSFTGRGYRIDPERPELGVLQLSPSAGIRDDDWIDVGVGFTNLQVAMRYYEEGSTVDRDGSGDPERNWYSGDNLETPPADAKPIAVSLSLEARSPGNVSHVPSSATPAFIDLERPDHNPVGDWGQACAGAELDPCGIDLANTSDAQRPERYRGDHIYRWTTITVNFRNMGLEGEVAAGGDE